jgi:two-component system sensor histidine kinase KdpD
MDTEDVLKSEGGSGGHYLVAVSGSGNSEYLIRWTSAAAKRLNATWTALHVRGASPEADPAALERNLDLARRLGAEVLSIPDEDTAATLVRYARIKKATALVIGKAGDGPASFRTKRSVMESILRESGDIDLIVLRGKNPVPYRRRGAFAARLPAVFRGFPVALSAVSAVTIFGLLALPALGYRSISILYLLAIISLPFACSRASVFAGAAISTLAWNFLFIPPRMTFTIGELEDVLMFAAFFLAAFVGGFLTSRLKEKEAALSLREERMAFLYGFSRALSRVRGAEEIAAFGSGYAAEHLGVELSVYLRGSDGNLCAVRTPDAGSAPDAEAVRKCFAENATAEGLDGRLYVPLGAPGSALGALVLAGKDGKPVRGEARELLATLAGNLALALERELLAAANEEHKMAAESERLTRVLLNHVSHELRTPLTTIKGSVSGLLDGSADDDAGLRNELLSETLIAADKLNALVEDLLSMSRLETKALRPNLETTYVAELLGAAQGSLAAELAGRGVSAGDSCRDVELDADPALMVQVFRNVLRNFAAYTAAPAILRVEAEVGDRETVVSFADDGPGVPERELPSLFDTFFRGSGAGKKPGCGLGLSICRGIVEAHGGSIRACATAGGGLTIAVSLPRRGEA